MLARVVSETVPDDQKEEPGREAPAGWYGPKKNDTNWLPYVLVGGAALALFAS